MYIRQSSRTYKGKTYINYLLVESILTPKSPRQKIICSLGDLRPRPHAEWLALAHKLSSAFSGPADLLDTPAPDSEWQDLLAKVQSAAPPSLATDATHPTAANPDLLAVHRSEEHTSELQSLRHLVCRLLLEKKNNFYPIWLTSRQWLREGRDPSRPALH